MSRIRKFAVVGVFFLAASAFGQAPVGPPAQSAGVGWNNDPSTWRPVAPAEVVETRESPWWGLFGPTDARGNDQWMLFGSADYLLGWVKGDPLPVIVSTSPAGTPQNPAGVLNVAGSSTVPLFGGKTINTEVRSGVRANLGAYIDAAGDYVLEAGFFGLESASSSFQGSSSGTPILARPYTDITTGANAATLVAFPGFSSGSIRAVDSARNLYGANFDIRERVYSSSLWRFDTLLGYRYLRYDESLRVNDTIMPSSGPFTPGTSLTSSDNFGARNIFNGIDVGFRSEFDYDALSLAVYGKVAAGILNRTSSISGSETTNVPGAGAVTSQGGMLALANNMGTQSHTAFSALPEVGANLGYQINDHVRFTVGYSVLWVTNVVRPGNEIDTNLNPGLFPGNSQAAGTPNNPVVTGQYSNLWVQALNFGLQIRY